MNFTWQKPIIERLAEIEHKQWMQWAKKIMETETISPERAKRWKKLFVPFEELSEEWKEYDREWARHVLREVAIFLEDEI